MGLRHNLALGVDGHFLMGKAAFLPFQLDTLSNTIAYDSTLMDAHLCGSSPPEEKQSPW